MTDNYHPESADFVQYARGRPVIDIHVQDPRVMHKTVMDKYVILNYNPNYVVDTESAFPETPSGYKSGDVHQHLVDNPTQYCSIIVNPVTKRAVSIAPSAPMPLDEFIQRYPVGTENIQITQMTEGTLIQLFYDTNEEEWQIATRSSIGGNNHHYRTEYPGYIFQKQKTFREMFYDALTHVTNAPQIIPDSDPDGIVCNLSYNPDETYYNTPLSSIPYIKTLEKSCCYSYIITHPSNPITNVLFIPTITLVAVCEIMNHGIYTGKHTVYTIPQCEFAEMIPQEYRRIVRVQETFDWTGKSLEEETLNHMFMNDVHPGLMLTNTITGERAILENVSYKAVAQLRGNHPNLHYQFFELYLSNRLGEFLTRFPMFNGLFMYFFYQYYDFTFWVYSTYVQYYIHKNREYANNASYKYASRIHRDIYIPSVEFNHYVSTHHPDIYVPNRIKTKITQDIVQGYFDKMTPGQLYHIVTTSMVQPPALSSGV